MLLKAKYHFQHVTQSIDCNPLSDSNVRLASADLDQQIAECSDDAKWLEMLPLLLWKGQLQQVVTLLCLVCHTWLV